MASAQLLFGQTLNENQKQEMVNVINPKENTEMGTVTLEDFQKYLDYQGDSVSALSTVYIDFEPENKAIIVDIVTPENITEINKHTYANVAYTAGLTNVYIKVASPVKVTGESALVGVYKAIDKTGIKVNLEDVKIAELELSLIQEILKREQDIEDEILNKALIDMKLDVSEIIKREGAFQDELASGIVEDKVNKYNLNVSLPTIENLGTILINYAKSSIAHEQEGLDALNTMANNLEKGSQINEQFSEQIDPDMIGREGINLASILVPLGIIGCSAYLLRKYKPWKRT